MGPLWALEGKLYESECPGDVAVPAAAQSGNNCWQSDLQLFVSKLLTRHEPETSQEVSLFFLNIFWRMEVTGRSNKTPGLHSLFKNHGPAGVAWHRFRPFVRRHGGGGLALPISGYVELRWVRQSWPEGGAFRRLQDRVLQPASREELVSR